MDVKSPFILEIFVESSEKSYGNLRKSIKLGNETTLVTMER